MSRVCVFERFVTHACCKLMLRVLCHVARSHSLPYRHSHLTPPPSPLPSCIHLHIHRPPSTVHCHLFLHPPTDHHPHIRLRTTTFPRPPSPQDLNNFRNTVEFFQPSVMFCQGMNVIDGEKMPDTKDGEKARTVNPERIFAKRDATLVQTPVDGSCKPR